MTLKLKIRNLSMSANLAQAFLAQELGQNATADLFQAIN
jgi:hypothetical protein